MTGLSTQISRLPSVTLELSKRFSALGLRTLHDAITYWPFRHEDWRRIVQIAHLKPGSGQTIAGSIVRISSRRARQRRLMITEAVVTDASRAKLTIVWFNQPYLATWLKPGQTLFFSGRVLRSRGRLQMQTPLFERPSAAPTHESLIPIYPSTAGLSQWQIRKIIKRAVALAPLLPDPLPVQLRDEYSLVDYPTAVIKMHFPDDPDSLAAAVRRLKFDELLRWQLAWLKALRPAPGQPAPAIPFQADRVRSFVQALPFKLTDDQRGAAWQILQDIEQTRPMSRLVQGDVGSGKTVVAAIAARAVAQASWQTAVVAPTVVLAEQHWQTLRQLLEPAGVRVALLTGSRAETGIGGSTGTREEFLTALRQGRIQVAVGTHALFSDSIVWHRLGLVIIDEQQRFGVDQRQTLIDLQRRRGLPIPHFLSLTATPIPRTLALSMAGELHISSIRHKPPGRVPVATSVIGPDRRAEVAAAVKTTLDRGEQVYVITPLIEASDVTGQRAAAAEAHAWGAALPGRRVGLLHGQLPAEERLRILTAFRDQTIDLLVSTTVIEVGVDVPNATLMIIEGAERFGLSQLHQLRGRVGRGQRPGACYFVTDEASPDVRERLMRVAETNDGFAIAELDLEQRGTGDVYGVRQSGLPAWRLASLTDTDLFEETKRAARALITAGHTDVVERLASTVPAPHPE